MNKIKKISTIIITAFLTLTSLWQVIPNTVPFKTELSNILIPLVNNPTFSALVGVSFIVLGSFVIISTAQEIRSAQEEHTFALGNRRFRRFFTKWYSQSGTLSIICDDLQGWLVTDGNEDILNALREKSKKKELHLFLGKELPPEIINDLKLLGATVHPAPKDIILNYSFSCISVMGNNAAVIIRNKQKDAKNMIKFEEISNTYVTGLMNSLIENIKGEST